MTQPTKSARASTRGRFLQSPYSGYHHWQVLEEDTYLTHVGPGTPCGEYFRRFWHPVAFDSDLGDLPLPVKILGEELVLFRDGGGRIGRKVFWSMQLYTQGIPV